MNECSKTLSLVLLDALSKSPSFYDLVFLITGIRVRVIRVRLHYLYMTGMFYSFWLFQTVEEICALGNRQWKMK